MHALVVKNGIHSELFPQHRILECMSAISISGETLQWEVLISLFHQLALLLTSFTHLFFLKKNNPKLYFSSHAREHEDSSVEHVVHHCTRKHCPKEVAAWYYSFA